MSESTNWSVVGRLLEEISWEGSSVRKYRQGGRGLENVLTAEALMLLDYLPRDVFLADVFRAAHGADLARERLAARAEDLRLRMLPDELHLPPNRLVVQPDALAETHDCFVLIEAKRIRSSSFQVEQLAREYVAVVREADGRLPLLLLVLGAEPPVTVKRLGRMSPRDAIATQLPTLLARVDATEAESELLGRIDERVAWITWAQIADVAAARADQFDGPGPDSTVRRLAHDLVRVIQSHT